MKHLNSNKLCSVNFRTTGPIPRYHDLIEIAVIPIEGLKPDKSILPFNMLIQPQHPDTAGRSISKKDFPQYMGARPPFEVMGLFEKWYKKLNLRSMKRIIPVGYKLYELRPFLIEAMGWSETGENYIDEFFDFNQARNMETLTHYWNDLAWRNKEPYPFHKHDRTYAAHRLGFVYDQYRTTLSDAFMTIETWGRITNLNLPIGVPLPLNYPRTIDYSVYTELEHKEEEDDDT